MEQNKKSLVSIGFKVNVDNPEGEKVCSILNSVPNRSVFIRQAILYYAEHLGNADMPENTGTLTEALSGLVHELSGLISNMQAGAVPIFGAVAGKPEESPKSGDKEKEPEETEPEKADETEKTDEKEVIREEKEPEEKEPPEKEKRSKKETPAEDGGGTPDDEIAINEDATAGPKDISYKDFMEDFFK